MERVTWIASSLEGTELVIGPGFSHKDGGPCYLCWRLREISSASNSHAKLLLENHLTSLKSGQSHDFENLAASADIVGGMLSAEVLTSLTQTSPMNLDGKLVTLQLLNLEIDKHIVLRKPNFPVCSGVLDKLS